MSNQLGPVARAQCLLDLREGHPTPQKGDHRLKRGDLTQVRMRHVQQIHFDFLRHQDQTQLLLKPHVAFLQQILERALLRQL